MTPTPFLWTLRVGHGSAGELEAPNEAAVLARGRRLVHRGRADNGEADTFARWIAAAIDTYARRTPEQRAGAKPRGRAEKRTGSSRSFAIPTDTVARMRAAITADQQAGRWPSDSAWCGEAIAAAVDQARNQAGGSLPTPPPRLPNRLVRR